MLMKYIHVSSYIKLPQLCPPPSASRAYPGLLPSSAITLGNPDSQNVSLLVLHQQQLLLLFTLDSVLNLFRKHTASPSPTFFCPEANTWPLCILNVRMGKSAAGFYLLF